MRPLPLAVLLALFVPATAYAEVMDKVLPVFSIWAWSVTSGLAGLFGWPSYRPLAILGVLGGGYLFAGVLSELGSADVGPAIAREAGAGYALHSFAALGAFVLLHAAGLALRARRHKRATSEDAACCR